MDLTKGGKQTERPIRFRITLTRFADGGFQAKFEGIQRRADVLPLLKQCDKLVIALLQKGAKLGERDSIIESKSPQERKAT